MRFRTGILVAIRPMGEWQFYLRTISDKNIPRDVISSEIVLYLFWYAVGYCAQQ
jgi:hypothetical protein